MKGKGRQLDPLLIDWCRCALVHVDNPSRSVHDYNCNCELTVKWLNPSPSFMAAIKEDWLVLVKIENLSVFLVHVGFNLQQFLSV